MLYPFDEGAEALDLLPLAARRALDRAGLKLSLSGWRSLGFEQRQRLVELGAHAAIEPVEVQQIALRAVPEPAPIPPSSELPLLRVPEDVRAAFSACGPLSDAAWSALSNLDRYALAKVSQRARPERVAAAYAAIVGHSQVSPHLAAQGGVRMVGVGEKTPTRRAAIAESQVSMAPEVLARLVANTVPKGDVLGAARLAAIMAAKKTSDLIPLCHPLCLTKVEVELVPDTAQSKVQIRVLVEALDRTGVEMEALTAATVAGLTIYDMMKALDRAMVLGPTRLVAKSGGRSGDFSARDAPAGSVPTQTSPEAS